MKPSAASILELLRRRGPSGVSPAEARLLAGCDRLAARVCELRAEGFDITTHPETCLGATYARYRLHEAPVQLSAFDSPALPRQVPHLGTRQDQAAERQPQRVAR